MAVTVLDMIKRSLRLLGVKGAGENLSSEEANDGFQALNSLVDSWNNESLMIYNLELITHTMVPGTGDYTIGPGATINVTRPQNIQSAYINDGDADWPIIIIKDEQFNRIWDKDTQSSYPEYLYYRSDYPTGTIEVWPIPSAAHTLNLSVWNQLTAFASTVTTISLPPGYQRALEYNLAMEIAPEYGANPSNVVGSISVQSKSKIKAINSKQTPILKTPMKFLANNKGFSYNLRGLFNA